MENAPADVKLIERSLTELQAAFIRHYVNGAEQTEAARIAGYAHPAVDAHRLMKTPHIQAIIQAELVRRVQTEGMQVAANFLINVIGDKKAPYSARVDAAKTMLNKGPLADKILANQSDPNKKTLSERSTAELEEFIAAGLKALDDKAKSQAIDVEVIRDNAQPIDVTTSN